mgnify:FL=1
MCFRLCSPPELFITDTEVPCCTLIEANAYISCGALCASATFSIQSSIMEYLMQIAINILLAAFGLDSFKQYSVTPGSPLR